MEVKRPSSVLKTDRNSDGTTQKPRTSLLSVRSPQAEPESHHKESKPTMVIATPQTKGMSSTDIEIIPDDDDDDEIAVLYYHKAKNVISVEQYSEDTNLQRAIMASIGFPKPNRSKRRVIDLTHEYPIDDDDVKVIASWTPSRKTRKRPFTIAEKGESSNSKSSSDDLHTPTFICEICVEPKSYNESFSIMGCTHSYCSDCMIKYVASKLQDNITQIRCPVSDCKGLLEPEHCRSILPPEVFDWWGSALCEAVILGSEKFYCPYKDCSALLINDPLNGEVIRQSECPNCYRLFCAQCNVAWHLGIECAEFQKLNKDEREKEDIMLLQLAKNQKWIRCPKCRFYVEKSAGCLFMRCRCGHTFCYNCGEYMTEHYCRKCRH
ncbi:E3 ubiquitin-protein ligase RSL1-like [Cornus florida]|uniref:E3 ubiquitin-protein ligase RSL1-like n=1 Tax=Cornus florida TaxID=4283 RepID=UPI00289C1D7B|nr:E3 ubiquitin-protein ligase RSL1-like [Cornus florida]